LTLSSVGTAALGTAFWAVASRSYPAEVVGLSTAAVAALLFVTGVSSLYLDGVLYRFLPRAGDATGALLNWVFVVDIVGSVVVTAIFLGGLEWWAPELSFATSTVWIALICVAATVGSSLLVVQDGALIGLRRTGWVPIRNLSLSLLKLLALFAFAELFPKYGILLAWVIPLAVIGPVTFVLLRRLVPEHEAESRVRQEGLRPGQVARYASGNYAGFLCTLAYRNVPPLLVLHQAGARASAFFYPPWLIVTSVALLTTNLSVSLVVEGSLDRDRLALQARQAILQSARLLLPIATVLLLGAPWILRIFGAEYAEEGDELLRLLAIALIPSSICIISFGVARVRNRVAAIFVHQVLLAGLVLGLSAALLPGLGITGVGVAWLIAQTVVALLLFSTELRPALRLAMTNEPGRATSTPQARAGRRQMEARRP
jgi:O-antigen/teichoic acid export membrane protein